MTFERPVRLRDRVPVPPKGPTIAAGSALAAVGAGAALYLWLRRRDEVARADRRAASGSADLLGDERTQRDEYEQQQQLLHEVSFEAIDRRLVSTVRAVRPEPVDEQHRCVVVQGCRGVLVQPHDQPAHRLRR